MSSNSWLYIWDVVLSCHCIIKDKPPTVCVLWLRPGWTAASNRWGCHAANNTSGAWRAVSTVCFFFFFFTIFHFIKIKSSKATHLLKHQASLSACTTSGPERRILTLHVKTGRHTHLRAHLHLVTSKGLTSLRIRFHLMMPEQMNVVPTYKPSGPSSLCMLH